MNRREFIFGSVAGALFSTFNDDDYIIKSTSFKKNELLECSEDIIYFAQKYIKLSHNKILVLKDWQKKYLRHIASGRYAVLCAYRQSGKTTLNMIYSVWKANFHPNQRITFIACNRNNEKDITQTINGIFDSLPSWMNCKTRYQHIFKRHEICTRSNSSITIVSSDFDFCGYNTGNVLILDEFAFYSKKNMKNVLDVIPVTLSTKNNQVLVASTPNKAYDLFDMMVSNVKKTTPEEVFIIENV